MTLIIDLTLADLAVAVYTFNGMTSYNLSNNAFRDAIGGDADLTLCEHRTALLKWLNRWGCRHLQKDQHHVASESIARWYGETEHHLPPSNCDIWNLEEHDMGVARDVYSSLYSLTAAHRKGRNGTVAVTIGPTGASKILFAVRPRAYMPWDKAIRDNLNYGEDGEAYATYLRDSKRALKALEQRCADSGFLLEDLPCQLGQPESTVCALFNAYVWVVHSQEVRIPSQEELRRWVKWSSLPEAR